MEKDKVLESYIIQHRLAAKSCLDCIHFSFLAKGPKRGWPDAYYCTHSRNDGRRTKEGYEDCRAEREIPRFWEFDALKRRQVRQFLWSLPNDR